MPNSSTQMRSWQIFHFARKHLTRSVLYAIFGKKNARAVDYWCEDPHYTAKPEKAYDPIQGVKDLIDMLDDRGHCGIVRATIAFLSSGTSAECTLDQQIVELLPSQTEENLADYRCLSDLHRSIDACDDIDEIERYKRQAIEEIERTVARYREDMDREDMT